MKIFLSFAVVMIAFSSSFTMEQPNLSQSIFVGNKEIQLANYKLLLAAREAVQGFEVEPEDFPIEGISEDILSSSPAGLVEYHQLWCDERIDMLILEKGISPDMVDAQREEASKRLTYLLSRERLEQPSDIIKQGVHGVAQEMGVSFPPVFVRHGKTASVVGGTAVCYSPQKLQKMAPTPRRKKAIYAHELAHRKHEDAVHKIAIRKAFEEAKKENDYDDDLVHEISRVKETHCDFTGGSLSLEYADHFERLWSIPDAHDIATTHPLRIQRRKLAQAWKEVHRLHEIKKRMEQNIFFSEAGKRLRECWASEYATSVDASQKENVVRRKYNLQEKLEKASQL